jgi:hypothetical protein
MKLFKIKLLKNKIIKNLIVCQQIIYKTKIFLANNNKLYILYLLKNKILQIKT